MSSKNVIVIDTNATAASFRTNAQLGQGRFPGLVGLANFIGSVFGGQETATLVVNTGAVAADGYIRVATGGSTNTQAMLLCNVVLTAVSSDPDENEFAVSATAATQAANMAAAINASASFTGKVTALASGGDVLLYAVVPGVSGNGLQVAAGNLSNVTVPKPFTNGSNGTSFTL